MEASVAADPVVPEAQKLLLMNSSERATVSEEEQSTQRTSAAAWFFEKKGEEVKSPSRSIQGPKGRRSLRRALYDRQGRKVVRQGCTGTICVHDERAKSEGGKLR